MIAGELKSKIDGLWETFATGGLTNIRIERLSVYF